MDLKQIRKKLQGISNYNDVALKAYNCSENVKILGGDMMQFPARMYDNEPTIGDQKICLLCEKESNQIYQWKIIYDDETQEIDLDLCPDCNSPLEIWRFVFEGKSWFSKLLNRILPNYRITYEMFFMYLIKSTYRREDDLEIKVVQEV